MHVQVQSATERRQLFEALEKQALERQAQHFQKKRADIQALKVWFSPLAAVLGIGVGFGMGVGWVGLWTGMGMGY